jgi:ribonuclease Z
MSLQLTILGCHSATPRVNAHPTAQLLQIKNHNFLIDCGEGTQVQMRKYKISFAKVKHIFISHLHGDHFYGLIGLISTFGLLNREKEIHIYGPVGLKKIIQLQLEISKSKAGFPIVFHELKSRKSELIYEDNKVTVHTIPLKHRIYTNGFLFTEKPSLRKLNIKEVESYPEIERCDYYNLKKGKDFICNDGSVIKNEKLTLPPNEPLSYAYCSDTRYDPSITNLIANVDMLYHESTFLNDKEELATKTGHSTALQAAKIAAAAQVKILLLGHYSNRYRVLSAFQKEAQKAFQHTLLAVEGTTFEVE